MRLDYRPLHLAVPVLRFGVRCAEDFEVPLAAPPRLDDLGRDDVHEDLGERPPFGVSFEVIRRLVPREGRVEHHRQKQVVPVVDDDELPAGALQGGVVDEVFLRAMRADVALERELARDDLFDRDFLVPAVAAVFLLAPRFGAIFGVADRAANLRDGFPGHRLIVPLDSLRSLVAGLSIRVFRVISGCGQRATFSRGRRAGAYMYSTYSLTIRRALNRGATVTMAFLTTESQRAGMPLSRS